MLRLLLSCSVLLLMACTTTRILVEPGADSLPPRVHFLPIEVSVDVAREHLEIIQRSTLAALRNRGFLVSEIRFGQSSPRPAVQLTIEQLRRDSVLAGHVNILSGRLRFLGSDNSILAESEHTESERGGLLFNSGQLLKGIVTELDNFEERAFDDWVERFAMSLVHSFPAPAAEQQRPTAPTIRDLAVTTVGSSQLVCFSGPAGHEAVLRIGSATVPMQEIQSMDSYCVSLPARLLAGENIQAASVALRSPFGLRTTQSIQLGNPDELCSDISVTATPDDSRSTIHFNVRCGASRTPCDASGPCSRFAFRLYETQSDGAFKFVDEFEIGGASRRFDAPSSAALKDRYRVFQVHAAEQFQKPTQLIFSSTGDEQ